MRFNGKNVTKLKNNNDIKGLKMETTNQEVAIQSNESQEVDERMLETPDEQQDDKDPRYHAVVLYPDLELGGVSARVISERTQADLKKSLSNVEPSSVQCIFRGKRMETTVSHNWSLK